MEERFVGLGDLGNFFGRRNLSDESMYGTCPRFCDCKNFSRCNICNFGDDLMTDLKEELNKLGYNANFINNSYGGFTMGILRGKNVIGIATMSSGQVTITNTRA